MQYICNGCYYILMMSINLNGIAILSVSGADHRRIDETRESDVVNLLKKNVNLTKNKGVL